MKATITLDERDIVQVIANAFDVSTNQVKLKIQETTEGYYETKVYRALATIETKLNEQR